VNCFERGASGPVYLDMPAIHKKSPRLRIEVMPNHDQSVMGGLVAVEAIAQQFGLWKKLAVLRVIDPLSTRGRG
jgi:hypothetical protein